MPVCNFESCSFTPLHFTTMFYRNKAVAIYAVIDCVLFSVEIRLSIELRPL